MAGESEERLPTDWTAKFKVEKNGRKTKYYMNVRTGQKFFSKEDLLRYVKMKRTQLDEPSPTSSHGKRHLENSSSKLVAKENKQENSRSKRHSENRSMKPVAEENSHDNGHGKRHSENSSTKPVVDENNRPDWLPDGWVVDLKTRKSGSAVGRQYKVYIEPITGCKFFSMPEVLRHLESVKNRNSECERKTTPTETSKYEGTRKVSTKREREATERVVVEKSTVVDLPPSWTKETKIKKTARGIRKDRYFTDPVSGYVFCSKKDVFRYLETGEISKYAFKPRKRGADASELVTDEALPFPYAKRLKLDHTATRRQLFPVKESSDICSPEVMKAEVLNKRRGKEVSRLAGAPTAEIPPEPMAKMVIDKGAETKVISNLSSSAPPKLRRSKRNQGKMVFADNGPVSTPVIDSLQEQRLLDSHIECSNGKTLNDMTKSAKRKKLNFPLRSSKRLVGLEPELVSNCMSIEQAPKKVTTESCKNMVISSAVLTSTGLVNKVSQHLKAGSVPELANVSSDVTILSSGEPLNKVKSSRSRTTPGEQLQKLKSAETSGDMSEQRVSLFFGNSYLDPCLGPAFKALIGELPVNSNPASGPVLNPAADILQETSMQTTDGEKRSSRKTRINSMQSKNKQELSLPRRSSKRLAGLEPEMMANCESLERVRAPKNIITESCKSKGTAAGLTSSSLVDEVSQQLKAGPVLGLPNRASVVLGLAKCVSSSRKPLNKIKSSGNLAIIGGQSAEANDDKSEPHLSLTFGGTNLNPCKTMMGETLVDSLPDSDPVSTTADILTEKKLQETKVEKSNNKKTRINSKKSKNKQQLNLSRRSSKRLAGLEPELVSNSISGEQAWGNATVESCKSEAPTCEKTDPHGLPDGVSQQSEAGHETMLAQHDLPNGVSQQVEAGHETMLAQHDLPNGVSQQVEAGHETMLAQHDPTDILTPLLESSDKSGKPLEAQTVPEEPSQKLENEKPEEQPQKLESERMDIENPDSQVLLPYGDSWSDPCLEFAFKTLTGAIPVDENLAIQDYFQHQLDPSDTQKDNSLAMPEFGPIKSFQTDVPHQLDTPEKQPAPAPQQQLPANPLPPPGNASTPSSKDAEGRNLNFQCGNPIVSSPSFSSIDGAVLLCSV
ncbi:hypothetical protein CUMW_162950 [Citrus unshiu]|uniref:MBD domain-containing protein n=1 Tax=Citrus unshiu TaxID=55188 RepID=A0A2H5PSC0_CITUN|nr:hypothetical protein CUMW_162950 [Citrus unshiu]